MGNTQSLQKVSFQDMIHCVEHKYTIITVMKYDDNLCLIKGTVPIINEEPVINKIYSTDLSTPIVIYGYNSCDENVIKKYIQLKDLGFTNIYVYPGGMFEWLLLQDIYTDKYIKTNLKEMNLLKYRPDNLIIEKN